MKNNLTKIYYETDLKGKDVLQPILKELCDEYIAKGRKFIRLLELMPLISPKDVLKE